MRSIFQSRIRNTGHNLRTFITIDNLLMVKNCCRDVTKSRLSANFNGSKRAYHQLKLKMKTKTWGNFRDAVE